MRSVVQLAKPANLDRHIEQSQRFDLKSAQLTRWVGTVVVKQTLLQL